MDRKLVSLTQITVREYDDAVVQATYNRLDPSTRRLTSESLLDMEQDEDLPLTSAELHLLAAAERVADFVGYRPELPW